MNRLYQKFYIVKTGSFTLKGRLTYPGVDISDPAAPIYFKMEWYGGGNFNGLYLTLEDGEFVLDKNTHVDSAWFSFEIGLDDGGYWKSGTVTGKGEEGEPVGITMTLWKVQPYVSRNAIYDPGTPVSNEDLIRDGGNWYLPSGIVISHGRSSSQLIVAGYDTNGKGTIYFGEC